MSEYEQNIVGRYHRSVILKEQFPLAAKTHLSRVLYVSLQCFLAAHIMEILLPEPQHCVHMCLVFNGQLQSSRKREERRKGGGGGGGGGGEEEEGGGGGEGRRRKEEKGREGGGGGGGVKEKEGGGRGGGGERRRGEEEEEEEDGEGEGQS